MKVTCIADLHGFFPELPGGDLLIIAGDLTARNTICEYIQLRNWLNNQSYKKIVVIAGNHDGFLEHCDFPYDPEIDNLEYLQDSGTEFEGLKIWGSPWSLWFHGINPYCKAFTGSESELKKKWDLIPNDTDILITHGPCYGILDRVNCYAAEPIWTGSKSLQKTVTRRVKPALHVFGHIHEWGGKIVDFVTTKFINASLLNENYELVNSPMEVELK